LSALEIEVKFLLEDPAAIHGRILTSGGLSAGRRFERNFRFDDADGSLRLSQRLLRLREDPQVTLTYKAPAPQADPDFKVHQEVEVGLAQREPMETILAALGFQRVQCYEKWRETFRLGLVDLCLDHLPLGDFLEIEGPRKAIRQAARDLGLEWERRILANYLAIFEGLRREHHLVFTDLTFANFDGLATDWKPSLRAFEGAPG
jgi:adenylate cyclase class 2